MNIKVVIMAKNKAKRKRMLEVCKCMRISPLIISQWGEQLESDLASLDATQADVVIIGSSTDDDYGPQLAEAALTKHFIQPIIMLHHHHNRYRRFPVECPIPQISVAFPPIKEIVAMITEGPIINAHAALWEANRVRLTRVNLEKKEAELQEAKRTHEAANCSFDKYIALLQNINKRRSGKRWQALDSICPHVGA